MMSEVGKVTFGMRCAYDVDEVIVKSLKLANVINAADETELETLRNRAMPVWQNSVTGLLALRLMPDHSEVARCALSRLTEHAT